MFPDEVIVEHQSQMKTVMTYFLTLIGSLFIIIDTTAMVKQAQDPIYKLIWSDEFDGSGLPDDEKWHFQTQWIIPGIGWANGELQHYTDRLDNARVEDGVLKIIAKKETFTDSQGTRDYTSARLNSKFAFTYGKVVVRAKLPDGIGTWPAIWMLGTNISETGGYWNNGINKVPWPLTGEIDIMEQFGSDKQTIHGTVHHAQESGGTSNTASTPVSTSTTEFHDYSIIWDEDEIQFLVDDELYYTYNPETKYPGIGKNINTWPFFEPQYLLLNIAMGGSLGGVIDTNFTESTMEVDYVRVYQPLTEADRDASLSALNVNGILVEGFESDKLNYEYEVEASVSRVPDVTFTKTIEDATVQIFEAPQIPGTTTIQVTAADGASRRSYSVEFTQADPVLGLNDESIKVYPNPTTDKIRIALTDGSIRENTNLRIVDIGGIEHEVNVQRGEFELIAEVSSLSPGVYFIKVNSRNFKTTRFIKR